MEIPKVIDTYKRPLKDLRISLTDRCNFRCTYCMPKEKFGADYPFLTNSQLLSNNEIVRLAKLFVKAGVTKIRLTGGEPLLRPHVEQLICDLKNIPGIEDIAMTTNGSMLINKASRLKENGLDRVTISLDSLKDERFGEINGQGVSCSKVLNGINAACEAGLKVKINMMVRKGINDDEIVDMLEFFKGTGHILRFIEFMDVGNTNDWSLDQVTTKQDIIDKINEVYDVEPLDQQYFGEVANRYRLVESGDEFGVISSISDAFCSSCTRARLSADGSVYTCLFASVGKSLRNPLRNGETDQELFERILSIWSHRTDRYSEERQNVPLKRKKIEMSYIGG